MANTIYKDDIGTIFRLLIGVDITGINTTTSKIVVKEPDDSVVNWDLLVEGSSLEGIVYHEAEAGDLDQLGVYQVQVHAIFAADSWYGEAATFTVTEPPDTVGTNNCVNFLFISLFY